MKFCNSCNKEREDDCFWSKKNGKLYPKCKGCRRKDDSVRNARKRRERREITDRIKVERGCVDCGYKAHPAALHFDHRDPSEKLFHVSESLLRDWSKILKEIEKCEVRCANCHAIKTVTSGQQFS